MYELRVATHFAAAHQLQMVAQKCENLHGHNWKVDVCVRGEKLDAGGVLVDFGVIKRHVADIMEELDHKFLNQLEPFRENCPPSSENIARYVARRLQTALEGLAVHVSSVSAWESDNACATYFPPPDDL